MLRCEIYFFAFSFYLLASSCSVRFLTYTKYLPECLQHMYQNKLHFCLCNKMRSTELKMECCFRFLCIQKYVVFFVRLRVAF
jgi:hypothetical protein